MNKNKPIVSVDDISFVGENLNRPESVLVQNDGSIYCSHRAGGITHIAADGQQKLIGAVGMQANGHDIVPNGICRMSDGSFLIANIFEGGGVWKLNEDGQLSPYLMEVDGVFLSAANFVMTDKQGRIWITVSTVSESRFDAYSDQVADGLIVVVDDNGARIVNDSICFANECRLTPDGKQLYISETFAKCITRFDVAEDGSLSNREIFARFSYGDFPDGCDFDAAGNLWVTCIVSNRLYRVSPAGEVLLVVEDMEPDHLDWVETAVRKNQMGVEHFYKTSGKKLKNIASVAFGGKNGNQVYMGALADTRIATFTLPAELAVS
jgi:SMP-30/gluconolaconase/LRE-like protein